MKTFTTLATAIVISFFAANASAEVHYGDWAVNDLGHAVSMSENHEDVLMVRDRDGNLQMSAKFPELFGCYWHEETDTFTIEEDEVTYLVDEDKFVRFTASCDTKGMGVWLTPTTMHGKLYMERLFQDGFFDIDVHGYEFSTSGYEEMSEHQLEASRGI